MRKKIYSTPLFEVLPMETLAAIMKTSVFKEGLPEPAPRRRTEVF